jgi:hypothetical protein
MSERSVGVRAVRIIALVWLLGVGPLNLAATISRLLPRLLDQPSPALLLLTAARVCTAALGMAVGLTILRASPGVRPLAIAWLALESVTLALIWGTDVIPTNRPPGLLVPTVVVYAFLAALVWTTARRSR